jgi:hypothetical protein
MSVAASGFHEGEQRLQARLGVAERLAQAGPRVLRDHMPQQHRDFFAQLPFLVAGLLGADGQPWAGVLSGAPGFAWSPHDRLLRVDARLSGHDPLVAWLRPGAPLGLLGLEPHTRRRNRLNGWLQDVDGKGFSVAVGQSFGNCPKYIQARHATHDAAAARAGPVEAGIALDAPARRMLREADTFFIATAHPQAAAARDPAHGVDVAHRGGPPGFIEVDGDALVVPDYAGNAFFNTFGNLALEPRCGLVLIDFPSGDTLWLTARAAVDWDAEQAGLRPGAQRLLRLEVTGWRRVACAQPLRWGPAASAPEFTRF